jgi:hypothetical protein
VKQEAQRRDKKSSRSMQMVGADRNIDLLAIRPAPLWIEKGMGSYINKRSLQVPEAASSNQHIEGTKKFPTIAPKKGATEVSIATRNHGSGIVRSEGVHNCIGGSDDVSVASGVDLEEMETSKHRKWRTNEKEEEEFKLAIQSYMNQRNTASNLAWKGHTDVISDCSGGARAERNTVEKPAHDLKTAKCHSANEVNDHHGFMLDKDLHELTRATQYHRRDLISLFARFKVV